MPVVAAEVAMATPDVMFLGGFTKDLTSGNKDIVPMPAYQGAATGTAMPTLNVVTFLFQPLADPNGLPVRHEFRGLANDELTEGGVFPHISDGDTDEDGGDVGGSGGTGGNTFGSLFAAYRNAVEVNTVSGRAKALRGYTFSSVGAKHTTTSV